MKIVSRDINLGDDRIGYETPSQNNELLFHFSQVFNPCWPPASMNNTENYNFGRSYFIDNKPAKANSLTVDFVFSRDLFAFTKGKRTLLNTVNDLENRVTDSYCI